jgi:hypothetical protein
VINIPPISEKIKENWSQSWAEWFGSVFSCLSGWKRTWNKTATIDFASINATSESAASTVTIVGVRAGDVAIVSPLVKTAGIIYDAVVTANDTVSVYAENITGGAINPASTTFRIIVFQN